MDWVIVVAAALGSGVLGSIVTTYGSQTRERTAARAEVRQCLRHVERLALHPDTSQEYHTQLVSGLDDLEGAMLIAGLPSYLAAFYSDVRLLAYATHTTEAPEERRKPRSPWVVSSRVAYQTAVILAGVVWHPWLSAPTRRWRIRRLRWILDGGIPDRAQMRVTLRRSRREWERDLLRRYLNGEQGQEPSKHRTQQADQI